MPKTELFVGNLDRDIQRKEIEDVFEKYGRLLRCDIKNKGNGPAYCFLEFEEERDAEDALRAENGKDLSGQSMVVEWAKARGSRDGRDSFRGGRDSFRGGRDRGGFRGGRGGRTGGGGECYECGERGHFARDCRRRRDGGGGGGGAGGGRDRRTGDRDRRDRDRSRDRRRDSNSRSRSRSPDSRRSYDREERPARRERERSRDEN